MKKIIFLITMIAGSTALADHSLLDAMGNSAKLSEAVHSTTEANNVVCDLVASNQAYAFPEEVGSLGTAWKQIALCFDNYDDLFAAHDTLVEGNSLGFYGVRGVVGVLVAKYTWENFKPGKVISVDYQ